MFDLLLCNVTFNVILSFEFILLRKRGLVTLLSVLLSCGCLCSVSLLRGA